MVAKTHLIQLILTNCLQTRAICTLQVSHRDSMAYPATSTATTGDLATTVMSLSLPAKRLSPGKRLPKSGEKTSELFLISWQIATNGQCLVGTTHLSFSLLHASTFESDRVRVRKPWPGSPRMKESPNQSPKQQGPSTVDFAPSSPSYQLFPKVKSPPSARRIPRKKSLRKAKVSILPFVFFFLCEPQALSC